MYHPIDCPAYDTSYNVYFQQHYRYPLSLSYDNTSHDAIPSITVEKRKTDEKNIEDFLLSVKLSDESHEQKSIGKASKIAITKNALASACRLNEELERICRELKDNKDLPEESWQERINICNTLKQDILKYLEPLKNPWFLSQLRKDVERRRKKRLREKLKREKLKNEKLLRMERRARLHAEIDSWIRKEQSVIEKEKQDENLRKEADIILSDVRGKRTDARKYLGLLRELQHLRNVKANIAKARGEHLSSAADEAFNNIIAKLTEQWLTLDREYSIEEQGLKLMLKTDNEKRIEKQRRNVFDDWENVLFGKKILNFDQLHPDINTFVATRSAWDKYISSDCDATPIPIGWILPVKPSSAAWQKLLGKEIS